jgi:hypothetical protein
MAGGWRLSNEDDLLALRRARHDARTLRSEEAWNHFAAQVAHCEQLGLLDDAVEYDLDQTGGEHATSSREVDDDGRTDGPPRYATAD